MHQVLCSTAPDRSNRENRRSLILTLGSAFFCFAVQAFSQAQASSPTLNDPDNAEVQQEGQFGPGPTMEAAGAEPNDVTTEKDGLEAETPDAIPRAGSIGSPNNSGALPKHEANANVDVEEVLGTDLNEPQ